MSEVPIGGVIHNNTAVWLIEDIYDGINLSFEAHCEECPNGYHDECWEEQPSDTILVGSWAKDENGLYVPDKTGEYAGITGEIYTQVVWSKHTRHCAMCSSCYPNQGDLDTLGEYLTYDLPPELYGGD